MNLSSLLTMLIKLGPEVIGDLTKLESGAPVSFTVGPEVVTIGGQSYHISEQITIQKG